MIKQTIIMTDLIKLLEDCVHPIKLIDEGNHCEKQLLERIEVAINELKQVKNLAISGVVGQSEQLCKHKRVIKSRLRMEDGKSRYCKDCQEWLT